MLQFIVYNCILREFPEELYTTFKTGRNKFPTTIHVLVSAVQKISREMNIADGLKLYRGLGGTMQLPTSFYQADKRGSKGFAEWGFMSTTSDRQIAIDYSGAKDDKPHSAVFVITAGAVDRGACIRDLSQYPTEVEYLWLPLSFLAPSGEQYLELTNQGLLLIIPVRVNANVKARTIEELEEQKKIIHLSSFKCLIDEVEHHLENLITQDQTRVKIQKETYNVSEEEQQVMLHDFVESIVLECKARLYRHRRTNVEFYLDDSTFRTLVVQALEVKEMAISKFMYWLKGKQNIFQVKNCPMMFAHREWMMMEERLTLAEIGGIEMEEYTGGVLEIVVQHEKKVVQERHVTMLRAKIEHDMVSGGFAGQSPVKKSKTTHTKMEQPETTLARLDRAGSYRASPKSSQKATHQLKAVDLEFATRELFHFNISNSLVPREILLVLAEGDADEAEKTVSSNPSRSEKICICVYVGTFLCHQK